MSRLPLALCAAVFLHFGCADSLSLEPGGPQALTETEARCIDGGHAECLLVRGDRFGSQRLGKLCEEGVDQACWAADRVDATAKMSAWCEAGNLRACMNRSLPRSHVEHLCGDGDYDACWLAADSAIHDIAAARWGWKRRDEVSLREMDSWPEEEHVEWAEAGLVSWDWIHRARSAQQRLIEVAEAACRETRTHLDCDRVRDAHRFADSPVEIGWAGALVVEDLEARCDRGSEVACDQLLGNGVGPHAWRQYWARYDVTAPGWVIDRRIERAQPACWGTDLAGCVRMAGLILDKPGSGVAPSDILADLRRARELDPGPQYNLWRWQYYLRNRADRAIEALELADAAISGQRFEVIPELGHACHGGRYQEYTCVGAVEQVHDALLRADLSMRVAALDALQHGCTHPGDEGYWCEVVVDVVEEAVEAGLLSAEDGIDEVAEVCGEGYGPACFRLLEQRPAHLERMIELSCGSPTMFSALLRFEGEIVPRVIGCKGDPDLAELARIVERRIDLPDVQVRVHQGWLLLEGVIYSSEQKRTAERIARASFHGGLISTLEIRCLDCSSYSRGRVIPWVVE